MERPWTVHALVALWLVGLVLPFVVDTSFGIGDPAGPPGYPAWADAIFILVGGAIAVGLWMGKSWAHSLSFALTAVGAFVLVLAFFFGYVTIWAVIQVPLTLFLLLHPATKRFVSWKQGVPAT